MTDQKAIPTLADKGDPRVQAAVAHRVSGEEKTIDNVAVQALVDSWDRLNQRVRSIGDERAKLVLMRVANIMRAEMEAVGIFIRQTIGGVTWERRGKTTMTESRTPAAAPPGAAK